MAIVLSIEDALQTISRSKASGVLRVSDQLDAVFVRGSLSHVNTDNLEQSTGVCTLLHDAGCLADQVVALVQKANVAVDQLGVLLISREYLTAEEFRRARNAYQKNRLFSLIENGEVQTEFSPDRNVELQEQSLDIQAAEILLDVVGLRSARALFQKTQALDETPLTLTSEYDVHGLTLEEIVIVKLLQQTPAGLRATELERRCLMSKAEFYIALRLLVEKRVVVDSGKDEELEVSPELNEAEAEDILSDLFDDDLESERDNHGEGKGSRFEADGFWNDDEDQFGQSFSSESTSHRDLSPPAEFEPESNKWADNEADGVRDRTFSLAMRLRMLNYRLTETSAVMHVVLVITIIYLVVLAYLMPSLLREWFEALSAFTRI